MTKQPGETIRVMLADDHPIVLEGMAAIVAREPDLEIAGLASDGLQAVAKFREHQPDVVLMDLRMPELDGVAAISAIRAMRANARIIVLTTFDGDEDIYRALRAGAQGYLLKDVMPDELLNAIRAVHAGGRLIPARLAQKVAGRLASDDLTEREIDVLRLLVEGLSNAEIAGRLSITEGTVKFHVKHILGKLGVADRTQAVIAALRRGLARL